MTWYEALIVASVGIITFIITMILLSYWAKNERNKK